MDGKGPIRSDEKGGVRLTGYGTSHGAITVINAMPCNIGATIGTELRTDAEFDTKGNTKLVFIENDLKENTEMARICVSAAYAVMEIEEPDAWSLNISSEIPISRGLKSSSSACNAILGAVFDRYNYKVDGLVLVRLGVQCARLAKVTVTGAFDDAWGCQHGGFVITDNEEDSVIFDDDIRDLDVLIHIPKKKIRKTGLPLAELRALAPQMKKIIELAKTDPLAAMTENGRLISTVQGVDNSIAEIALKHGALGAGMSGSGPAIAIVLEKGDLVDFQNRSGIYGDIITQTRPRHCL